MPRKMWTRKDEVVVYGIGGRISGTGDLIGIVRTQDNLRKLARRVSKMGGTGLSLHGNGFNGCCSINELEENITYCWGRAY